jgi:prolyl 4-hydroxylase
MPRFGIVALLLVSSWSLGPTSSVATDGYGVDCSFPIHSTDFKCGDLLGDRKSVYEDYMQGCRDFYGHRGNRCDSTEADRLDMSLRQPQSMTNYTSTGFKKNRAPQEVQDLLFSHWEINRDHKVKEDWGVGNIYSNHWLAPTYMVSVENENLRGAGAHLKENIWHAVKPTLEQWTGMELRPTSVRFSGAGTLETYVLALTHCCDACRCTAFEFTQKERS